jgi:hypothetical protein
VPNSVYLPRCGSKEKNRRSCSRGGALCVRSGRAPSRSHGWSSAAMSLSTSISPARRPWRPTGKAGCISLTVWWRSEAAPRCAKVALRAQAGLPPHHQRPTRQCDENRETSPLHAAPRSRATTGPPNLGAGRQGQRRLQRALAVGDGDQTAAEVGGCSGMPSMERNLSRFVSGIRLPIRHRLRAGQPWVVVVVMTRTSRQRRPGSPKAG